MVCSATYRRPGPAHTKAAVGSERRIGRDQAMRARAASDRGRGCAILGGRPGTERLLAPRQKQRAMLHEDGVEVPHTHLTPAGLRSLAEEFVTRDGTDYGQVEKTLEEKVAALMRQLERGEAAILYDSESQTISIVPRHGLR